LVLTGQKAARQQPSISSARLEFGQRDFRCDIVPGNCHIHSDFDFLRFTIDNICQEMRPLIQFHNCRHIGNLIYKFRVIRGMIYRIGVNGSMSAGNYSFGFFFITFWVYNGSRPADMAACLTLLKFEFVVFASVPERLHIGIYFRQRFVVEHYNLLRM